MKVFFGILLLALGGYAAVQDDSSDKALAPGNGEKVEPYKVNVVVVILNQNHSFSITKAKRLADETMGNINGKIKKQIRFTALHPDFDDFPGGWTILPILKNLTKKYEQANWYYFINEFTQFNPKLLIEELQKHDGPAKALFLGKALSDSRPTAIHHFANDKGSNEGNMEYPDFTAGFLMSRQLAIRLIHPELMLSNPTIIDIYYELAKLIKERFGLRVLLKDIPNLCGNAVRDKTPEDALNCISESHFETYIAEPGKGLKDEEICYAVKTFEGNHESRLSVLKKTWLQKSVLRSKFTIYSNVADPKYGTTAVPPNIPNVESGHCTKTMFILQDFLDKFADKCKWLVIVDDDTLVNTERLSRLLIQYSKMDKRSPSAVDPETGKITETSVIDIEAIAIGERYGFNFWPVIEEEKKIPDAFPRGYDYLTGGAGMALSRLAVKQLISRKEMCLCTHHDPDDMMLGLCLTRLGINILNSPLMHQASPISYPWDLIKHQIPITFHGFSDVLDGKTAYEHYLLYDWPKKFVVKDNSIHPTPEEEENMHPPPPGDLNSEQLHSEVRENLPPVDLKDDGTVPDGLVLERNAAFQEEIKHHEEL